MRGEDSRRAVTERVKPHARGLGASAVPGLLAPHLQGPAQRLQCSRRAQGPFGGQCTRHALTLHLHVFYVSENNQQRKRSFMAVTVGKRLTQVFSFPKRGQAREERLFRGRSEARRGNNDP